MRGDPGPYIETDGPRVWVPRTVPYLEARRLVHGIADYYTDRVVYTGKTEGTLFGFTVDCQCEEVCERTTRWDDDKAEDVETGDTTCRVPVWSFRLDER